MHLQIDHDDGTRTYFLREDGRTKGPGLRDTIAVLRNSLTGLTTIVFADELNLDSAVIEAHMFPTEKIGENLGPSGTPTHKLEGQVFTGPSAIRDARAYFPILWNRLRQDGVKPKVYCVDERRRGRYDSARSCVTKASAKDLPVNRLRELSHTPIGSKGLFVTSSTSGLLTDSRGRIIYCRDATLYLGSVQKDAAARRIV